MGHYGSCLSSLCNFACGHIIVRLLKIGIIKAQPKQLRFYGHSAGVSFFCISRIAPVKPAACGQGRILPPRMTLLIIRHFASTAE